MIFLDAGPLIAFFNRRDNRHEDSLATLKRLSGDAAQLITTNRVLSEVYDAIRYDRRVSRKKDAHPALVIFEAIEKGGDFISVGFLTEEIEKRAIAILRAYPDQNFSYCDACSFAFIETQRIRQVFTYDKDFRIYKFKRKMEFLEGAI